MMFSNESVKLYKGDCLELMKLLPDKSIDLILCDLPYGTTDCKWDTVIPFDPLWGQYKRIIKPKGNIVLFSAQPFTTLLINSNFKDYRYSWYWKKNNVTGALLSKIQPMRCIEDINVFVSRTSGKAGMIYYPQGLVKLDKPIIHKPDKTTDVYHTTNKKPALQTYTNYPKNLLEFKNEAHSMGSKRFHPTQKPVALLEYLIKTYTLEGETVLDNCMGSGSTGVAAVNTGRSFIGMELDNKYYNIAKERISEALKNRQS